MGEIRQDGGVPPTGSGCQPSASAPLCGGSSQSGIPNADERWLRCSVEFMMMQDEFGIHEFGYEAEFLHPRWSEFSDRDAKRQAILAWQSDGRDWYAPASGIEAATAGETPQSGSTEGKSPVGAAETPTLSSPHPTNTDGDANHG